MSVPLSGPSPRFAPRPTAPQSTAQIADDALTMFEGLGLLSADYGILDYVRGHYPELVNQRDNCLLLKFTLPPEASTDGAVSGSTPPRAVGVTVRVPTDGPQRGYLLTDDACESPGAAIKQEADAMLSTIAAGSSSSGSSSSSSSSSSGSSSSSSSSSSSGGEGVDAERCSREAERRRGHERRDEGVPKP
jgi:uncharacterized membrane protein YgcG